MTATFRASGSGGTGATTSATFSPTMPTGFVAGDLLIGVANSGAGVVPSTRPSGSTSLVSVTDTSVFNMDVVYKIAVGSDVFTWTVAVAQKWVGIVYAYTVGTFDPVTPIQGLVSVVQGTAATTFLTPSSTPGNSDSILVAAFGQQGAATWTCNQSSPTMIESLDTSSSGTGPVSIGAYRSTNTAPVSAITRTGTASLSSANGGGMMFFVNPSATAAAGPPPRRFKPQYRR